MPCGDQQDMARAHRILIKNRISNRGCRDHRQIQWEGTEGTGGRLLACAVFNCACKLRELF